MQKDTFKKWTVQDSVDLYNIQNWGVNFFSINEKGNVLALNSKEHSGIDLKELVHDLGRRGIRPPLIIRFSDILKHKVEEINQCFQNAISEYEYKGDYRAVFPIKTNQQKQISESVMKFGKKYQYGLEAGSKAELLAALAMIETGDSTIICNGYKDQDYINLVLHAQRSGFSVIPVVEKFTEVEMILSQAKQLGVKPRFGVRVKLSARGSGRWEGSGGDRSKFGLTVTELLQVVEYLKDKDMLDAFQLIHFHLGSQISNIRSIKESIEEASRVYLELCKKGAGLRYIDVGGGLGVDYDGSKTVFSSSINYTMQEYANDIIAGVMAILEGTDVPHPIIISESGRAVVAHHSVVIVRVLGSVSYDSITIPKKPEGELPAVIETFYEICDGISRKNFLIISSSEVNLLIEARETFNTH